MDQLNTNKKTKNKGGKFQQQKGNYCNDCKNDEEWQYQGNKKAFKISPKKTKNNNKQHKLQ